LTFQRILIIVGLLKLGGNLSFKKVVFVVLSVFFLCIKSSGFADGLSDYFNNASPSVGMSFLKIGLGARAVSLGGAYSAIVKDATAVYWNPGAVIYSDGMDVNFNHLSLMQGINYEFVAISTGDGNQGFGIGFGGLFYGGMELRDERPSVEPSGTFDAYNFLVKISYGHRLGSDFIGGVSLAGIIEKIYVYSASTYTVDFGLRYSPQVFKSVAISLNVNNLGPKVIFENETFRLPFTTKLGLSYSRKIRKTNIILCSEVLKSIDTPIVGAFGIETNYSFVSFRFGYNYSKVNATRLAGGMGIKYRFLSIDYSFSPYLLDLGTKQAFSVSFDF